MEDTTARKRHRDASEDDEAGDTAGEALGSSSRLATGIAEEKPAETLLLFIQEEDEEAAAPAFMEEPADDGTLPHALREREIDFFCYPPADDGGRGATAGSCLFAADQEPGVVDVALTLGGTGPLVARREDTVNATLRLGLGPRPHPPSSAATDDVAALGEAEDDDDDDLHYLRLHVPFSASTGPKLDDPFWYPLPFTDDLPCRAPPPSPATPEDHSALPEEGGFVVALEDAFNSFVTTGDDGFVDTVMDHATDRRSGSTVLNLNQHCSLEFPDDIAGDVDERPGRETAEQRHQSSTPYTFI